MDSLPSRREYLATHKNLESLNIGSNPLVTEGKVQTLSRRPLSTKAAGKRKVLEEDNTHGKIFSILALCIANCISIRTR